MAEDSRLTVLDEPRKWVQPENITHMTARVKARTSPGSGVLQCQQNLNFLSSISDQYLGPDIGRVVANEPASEAYRLDIIDFLTL